MTAPYHRPDDLSRVFRPSRVVTRNGPNRFRGRLMKSRLFGGIVARSILTEPLPGGQIKSGRERDFALARFTLQSSLKLS
jgi:hypothetical protein